MPNDDKELISIIDSAPTLLDIVMWHDKESSPWTIFKESVITMHEDGVYKKELIDYINRVYATMEAEEDGQLEFNFKEGI